MEDPMTPSGDDVKKIEMLVDRTDRFEKWQGRHEELHRDELKGLDEVLSRWGTFIERHELEITSLQEEKDEICDRVAKLEEGKDVTQREIAAIVGSFKASVDNFTSRVGPLPDAPTLNAKWKEMPKHHKVGLITLVFTALSLAPEGFKAIIDILVQLGREAIKHYVGGK